jgi:ribosomal protein L3
VHDATAGELRRADRALTGATGALLLVRLLAAAGDLTAVLRLVRALAGRMGNVRYTAQGLTIQAVDAENNLILVKGAIPGPKGALVLVRTAAKSKKGGVTK